MKDYSSNKRAEIKKLRRESTLERSISSTLLDLFLQIPMLSGVFVVDLAMSKRSGLCTITVASIDESINQGAVLAALSKISGQVRTVISKTIQGPWTPSVMFQFDKNRTKVNKLNEILTKNQFDETAGQENSEENSLDQIITNLKKNLT